MAPRRARGALSGRHPGDAHGAGGLRFAVRVRPGARRTAVGGTWDGPGGPALVVAVAAPAVDGKANAAVLVALAAALGVRPRRLVIVSGERARDKVVELAEPAPDTAARLAALLG